MKLILDIESEVIDHITKVAETKNVSVSKVAEDLFRSVSSEEERAVKIRKEPHEFSEWLQKIVLSKEPTPDFDHKAEYGKHLEEKYGL